MDRKNIWTDSIVNELVSLHKEGKYSTKQIGEILGFTKNAIVGKINRLGLNSKVEVSNGFKSNEDEVKPSKIKVSVAPVIKEVKAPKTKEGKYLLKDITLSMCVWPYGEENFTFCGKGVEKGKSYCSEHMPKSYIKVGRKNY